jgi:hypothetical protein
MYLCSLRLYINTYMCLVSYSVSEKGPNIVAITKSWRNVTTRGPEKMNLMFCVSCHWCPFVVHQKRYEWEITEFFFIHTICWRRSYRTAVPFGRHVIFCATEYTCVVEYISLCAKRWQWNRCGLARNVLVLVFCDCLIVLFFGYICPVRHCC